MKILITLLFVFAFPFLGISQERHAAVTLKKESSVLDNLWAFSMKRDTLQKPFSLFDLKFQRKPTIQFGFSGEAINRWTSPEYNWFKYLKDYRTREMVDFTNPNKNYPGGDYIKTNATDCFRYWLVGYDVHLFKNADFTVGF